MSDFMINAIMQATYMINRRCLWLVSLVTEEAASAIIEVVKSNPILWDSTTDEHKLAEKPAVWGEIAVEAGCASSK
jgi:hypothetical protein